MIAEFNRHRASRGARPLLNVSFLRGQGRGVGSAGPLGHVYSVETFEVPAEAPGAKEGWRRRLTTAAASDRLRPLCSLPPAVQASLTQSDLTCRNLRKQLNSKQPCRLPGCSRSSLAAPKRAAPAPASRRRKSLLPRAPPPLLMQSRGWARCVVKRYKLGDCAACGSPFPLARWLVGTLLVLLLC